VVSLGGARVGVQPRVIRWTRHGEVAAKREDPLEPNQTLARANQTFVGSTYPVRRLEAELFPSS